MRYLPHTHHCANRKKGCETYWTCNADPEFDEDGHKYCSVQPCDDVECDECRDAQCEDCGAYVNLQELHAADCTRGSDQEQDDLRDGVAGSYEYRQSEAMRVKR